MQHRGAAVMLAAQTGRGPYARIAVLRPHDGRRWSSRPATSGTWSGTSRRGSLDLVRLEHLGRRAVPVVRVRDVRAFGRQPGQRRHSGGGRAGQRAQRRAARRMGGERPLRVPAVLSRRRRAGADRPARVHQRRPGAGAAKAFEVGARRERPGLEGETCGTGWSRAAPRRATCGSRPDGQPGGDAHRQWRQALPDAVRRLVEKMTVEIWTLRPTMSLGLRTGGR